MRILASALLMLVSSLARADDVNVSVGGIAVRIPVDGGYVRESQAWPEGFAETSAKVTSGSRLAEYFTTPAELKAERDGHQPDGMYYQIVVQRAVEFADIGSADWKALQSKAASEMSRVDRQASDTKFNREEQARHAAKTQPDQLTITATDAPVIYRQTPMSFEFSSVVEADVDSGRNVDHRRIAVAGAVLVAHNRLLQLAAYRAINDQPRL